MPTPFLLWTANEACTLHERLPALLENVQTKRSPVTAQPWREPFCTSAAPRCCCGFWRQWQPPAAQLLETLPVTGRVAAVLAAASLPHLPIFKPGCANSASSPLLSPVISSFLIQPQCWCTAGKGVPGSFGSALTLGPRSLAPTCDHAAPMVQLKCSPVAGELGWEI